MPALFAVSPQVWKEAARRAADCRECGINAKGLMHGWIDLRMDPETALYDLRTHTQGHPAQLKYLSEWLKDGLNRTTEIMAPHMDNIWFRQYVSTADAMIAEARRQGGRKVYAQPQDYSIFTFDNYDQATGTDRYKDEIEKPLRWFMANRTRYCMTFNTLWPMTTPRDRWSDSFESFIILWSRHQETGDGRVWLDWVTGRDDRRHCTEQVYGCYRARHDDGSTGRNLVTHMHFQSRGVRMLPFSRNAGVGGVEEGKTQRLAVCGSAPWSGKLVFEPDRRTFKYGKLDWVRINEMVPGCVVRPGERYRVRIGEGDVRELDGRALLDGLPVRLAAAGELHVVVERL